MTGLAEMKILKRDICIFLSDYQNIETTEPKEMGISPGISCWQKEKTNSQKEISHSSDNLSEHILVMRLKAHIRMGQ